VAPAPVTMLTTPGGRSASWHTSAKQQRRQRRGLGRLEHHGVAAGQRRGDLPGEHEQREVPRDDLADDADGSRVSRREGAAELVGPAGVVEEVRRSERHVDVAALLDRLAVVEGLETANSRARSCRMRRAMRKRYFPRSAPSCATRRPRMPRAAAWTAASTSALAASAISASTSSVAGLTSRSSVPLRGGCQAPPMNSSWRGSRSRRGPSTRVPARTRPGENQSRGRDGRGIVGHATGWISPSAK
jgi:hypothetical protein